MAERQSPDQSLFRPIGNTNTLRIHRPEKQPTPIRRIFDSQSTNSSPLDSEPEPYAPTYEPAENKYVETNTKISSEGQATIADDMPPKEVPDLS